MKLGEWLLTRHPYHIQQLANMQGRYDQCRKEHTSTSETIEQLALHRKVMDGSPPGSDVSDPTFLTALEYADRYNADFAELTHQMIKIERQIRKLRGYVDVANIILKNVNENDRWFIENHFFNGISILALRDEKFPNGKIYSKSTLHNIKNRIIDDVSKTCEMMLFDPPDFHMESE